MPSPSSNIAESKIDAIISNATRNRMGITEARGRISALLGSLRGAQPQAGGAGDEKAVGPDGSLNQLHQSLGDTEHLIGALHADIDELFSLLAR